MSKQEQLYEPEIIVITKNSAGAVIATLTSQEFMTVGKEFFGIGRNKFLADYVNHYNETKKAEGLTAKIEVKLTDLNSLLNS